MPNLKSRVDALESRFVDWANKRDDIRAAIVVGSRACQDHPADDWADLDVGIVCRKPERYLTDHRWLHKLGEPLIVHRDPSGVTLHVLFEDGADGGFAFIPLATVQMAARLLPIAQRFPAIVKLAPGGNRIQDAIAEGREYYRRGARILIDKGGLAERLLALFPASTATIRPPSASEFTACVSHFWFVAVWMAKHLRRGELWRTLTESGQGQLTTLLLCMVEWQARAERGWQLDTWEGGRFIEEWADPRVVAELAGTFPHYDPADAWRALDGSMVLFAQLSLDVATRLGIPFDEQLTHRCRALVAEVRESEAN